MKWMSRSMSSIIKDPQFITARTVEEFLHGLYSFATGISFWNGKNGGMESKIDSKHRLKLIDLLSASRQVSIMFPMHQKYLHGGVS
jgi:hypothetical protein